MKKWKFSFLVFVVNFFFFFGKKRSKIRKRIIHGHALYTGKYGSHNVKVAQKPFQTLGHIFAKPKDPVTKEQRTDAIYFILCNTVTTNTSDRPNVSLVHL